MPSIGNDLYACIDELEPPNDLDFIHSPINPSNSWCEVKLQAVQDPQVAGGHRVKFRFQKSTNTGVMDFTVQLRQGTTIIAEKIINNVVNTWTDDDFVLTPIQADAITDYTDLRLRFLANIQ